MHSLGVEVLAQLVRGGPRAVSAWRSSHSQCVEVLVQPGHVGRGLAGVGAGAWKSRRSWGWCPAVLVLALEVDVPPNPIHI